MRRVVLVPDPRVRLEAAAGALAAAGLEAVVATGLADARRLVEGGALGVVIGVPEGGWVGEEPATLASWPTGVRRRCVVALAGPGLLTGDGVRAFLLGVDLLVSAGDLGKLGEIMACALQTKGALLAPLDPAAAARFGA
ncbi:MAG TPA: hypothetical protein P5234_04105 [Thermoanaerobaculaceae bacterium]|nr:hypothetical protein [Thermoanaerobaculaceae bacterium]HRS15415.1 hypothetical protein [Thermoanaerobaculaceae bacterium]